MRLMCVLLAAAFPFAASATIEGSWTVNYASGVEFKTIGGAEFTFHLDGAKLTGMANIGYNWPGPAPISEGKIVGDRIDFTVYGQRWSSSGYPEMHFVGTINGDKIQVSMVHFLHGERDGDTVIEFEGRRANPGEVNIPLAIGTFRDGRYHHNLTGTEFAPPADWLLWGQEPSSNDGEQVHLSSVASPMQVHVWLKPQTLPPDNVRDTLDSEIDAKARHRSATGYRMLPATFQRRTVGGQPAVSVQAEYFENSVLMTEYHTWVMSKRTQLYLSARVPAKDFVDAKREVDAFLATFLVP